MPLKTHRINHSGNLRWILFATQTICTLNFLWNTVKSKVQKIVKSHQCLKSTKSAKVDRTQSNQKFCHIDPIQAKIAERQQVDNRLIMQLTQRSLSKICTIMCTRLNKNKESKRCRSKRLHRPKPQFHMSQIGQSQLEDLTNFPSTSKLITSTLKTNKSAKTLTLREVTSSNFYLHQKLKYNKQDRISSHPEVTKRKWNHLGTVKQN